MSEHLRLERGFVVNPDWVSVIVREYVDTDPPALLFRPLQDAGIVFAALLPNVFILAYWWVDGGGWWWWRW